MKPYEANARHSIRKGWLCLGKAREARTAANLTSEAYLRDIMLQYSADMARIARQYIRNAVFYRSMNEVL